MSEALARARAVALRDGASAHLCPVGQTVVAVANGKWPFVFSADLASGTRGVLVMVVDGEVVRNASLETVGRYLRQVDFLRTRVPDFEGLQTILSFWGEHPPGNVAMDSSFKGPGGESGSLVFSGDAEATITYFGAYYGGGHSPTFHRRAMLRIDRSYTLKWVVETLSQDGVWFPLPPEGDPPPMRPGSPDHP